jgi:hypothetical protein
MADLDLTQEEVDALMAMEKHRINDTKHNYPDLGGKLIIPLVSINKRENFLLDVHRFGITLDKITFQNRARRVVVLVRLDFSGSPHTNPDDSLIIGPHLHLYRENYADKWAIPAPTEIFNNLVDQWRTLDDFMRYCNITRPPLVERGLFQ